MGGMGKTALSVKLAEEVVGSDESGGMRAEASNSSPSPILIPRFSILIPIPIPPLSSLPISDLAIAAGCATTGRLAGNADSISRPTASHSIARKY